MGLIRRWLNLPTFSERLVERLLDQNHQLLDRLLESRGVEPLRERPVSPVAVAMPRGEDEESLRERDRQEEIDGYAREAARDAELMEQAIENARALGGDWPEVVEKAYAMMERAN